MSTSSISLAERMDFAIVTKNMTAVYANTVGWRGCHPRCLKHCRRVAATRIV
jgi:hypothetical protein